MPLDESELDRKKTTPPELSAAQQREVDEAWDVIVRAREMMTEMLQHAITLYHKWGFYPPSQSDFNQLRDQLSEVIYYQLSKACETVGESVITAIDNEVTVNVGDKP